MIFQPALLGRTPMIIGEIYFWTATINNWNKLLFEDGYKDIIIQSLDYLSKASKIEVYGFVLMPTHLHFIWKILGKNGKESPQGSFLKFTAHQFRTKLIYEGKYKLNPFRVNALNKHHEFWQPDQLAIHLFSSQVAYQKLNYIHNNPLAKHWNLAKSPSTYKYSSASFYELNDRQFSFLKDLRLVFK